MKTQVITQHARCWATSADGSLVQEGHGRMVEAVSRSQLAVLGPASVHCCANLGSKHLAQLHPPLVKAVDAPHKALPNTKLLIPYIKPCQIESC